MLPPAGLWGTKSSLAQVLWWGALAWLGRLKPPGLPGLCLPPMGPGRHGPGSQPAEWLGCPPHPLRVPAPTGVKGMAQNPSSQALGHSCPPGSTVKMQNFKPHSADG